MYTYKADNARVRDSIGLDGGIFLDGRYSATVFFNLSRSHYNSGSTYTTSIYIYRQGMTTIEIERDIDLIESEKLYRLAVQHDLYGIVNHFKENYNVQF